MSEDNQNSRDEYRIGGHQGDLPAEDQLAQLASYLDAHYEIPDFTPPWAGGAGNPDPADSYIARLPDRITHTAMLMLGSAVDHSMPGVALIGDVDYTEVPEIGARQFIPSHPSGAWAVSFHSGGWWRGSGDALEFSWRPEVAAAAELSGTMILDLDYPLAPDHTIDEMIEAVAKAVGYAHHHNASSVAGWGYSSGAALATLTAKQFDSLVLTFPDLGSVAKLPAEIRGSHAVPAANEWPRTLVQVARQDEIAARPEGIEDAEQVTLREYVARHRVSTPAVAREKIQDVAAFLKG
ncbi:alpha/beta hydrolase [Corynebacterium sp. A21]|uniref:alpha/beta hydrolase n=1 Tax=Corynebacterium sp. A21 TaxID=3457318 RepID=UPI003FD43031